MASKGLRAISYQGTRNVEAGYMLSHNTKTLIGYIVCCAQYFIVLIRLSICQYPSMFPFEICCFHFLMNKCCHKSSPVFRIKNCHRVTKSHLFLSVHFCLLKQNSKLLRQSPIMSLSGFFVCSSNSLNKSTLLRYHLIPIRSYLK